jgi:hypothetical protein
MSFTQHDASARERRLLRSNSIPPTTNNTRPGRRCLGGSPCSRRAPRLASEMSQWRFERRSGMRAGDGRRGGIRLVCWPWDMGSRCLRCQGVTVVSVKIDVLMTTWDLKLGPGLSKTASPAPFRNFRCPTTPETLPNCFNPTKNRYFGPALEQAFATPLFCRGYV